MRVMVQWSAYWGKEGVPDQRKGWGPERVIKGISLHRRCRSLVCKKSDGKGTVLRAGWPTNFLQGWGELRGRFLPKKKQRGVRTDEGRRGRIDEEKRGKIRELIFEKKLSGKGGWSWQEGYR